MHLRHYQTEAVKAICRTFDTHDRAQLHAACGTGKTVIALTAAERLCPSAATIVITVPTLALAAQVIDTWQATTRIDAVLAVCSDETLTDTATTLADLHTAATTDPAQIRHWLAQARGRRLIVTTYKSAPTLGKVLRECGIDADLMICDEAHHLTGVRGRFTHQILHDGAFPVAKRLFMTATPRIDPVAAEAGTGDSMSDEDLFGPLAYHYPWAAAIGDGHLDDYRVAVIGIAETDLVGLLNDTGREWSSGEGTGRTLRTLAAQLACLKAAKQFGLRRILAFAGRISASKEFTRGLATARELLPGDERPGQIHAVHLDGTATAELRHRHLEALRHPPAAVTVLSNVRCLTEGVDVPSVDGIVFTSAKKSPVDTVQAIGRALRPSPGGQGTATIVVPIVIPAGDGDTEIGDLDPKEWAVLWEVVNALRALDDNLAHRLDATRHPDLGRPVELPERLTFDLPEGTDARLAEHLRLLLVRRTTAPWQEGHNAAAAYAAANGHLDVPALHIESGFRLGAWIQKQRRDYQQGALAAHRVRALEAIGMVWDVQAHRWNLLLEHVRQFCAEHGHADVHSQYVCADGYPLGGRIIELRRRPGRLPDAIRSELDALGIIWDKQARVWAALIDHLRVFRDQYGHAAVEGEFVCDDGYPLGQQVVEARRPRRKVPDDVRARLDELGFVWDAREHQWQVFMTSLRSFHAANGHILVPLDHTDADGYTLGHRLHNIRRDIVDAPERVRRELDALGMVWDLDAHRDELLLDHARAFKDEHGHARVSQTYRSADGFPLGDRLRQARRNRAKLRPQLREALDGIGIVWDPEQQYWNDLVDHFTAFAAEFGHQIVPVGYECPDGYPLGKRLRRARRKPDELPAAAVEALADSGMVWDLEAHRWQLLIDHARAYADEHGHLRIPKDYCSPDGYGLSNLLNNARRQRDQLPETVRRELEAIGMVWDVQAHRWSEFIAHLSAYRSAHGDLLVGHDYKSPDGYLLGKRVSKTRMNPAALPAAARRQLDDLGFVWDAIAYRWDLLIERLDAFADEHGHATVPQGYRCADGYRLGERLAYACSRTKPLPARAHRAITAHGLSCQAPPAGDADTTA